MSRGIRIAILGVGVVGSALHLFLETNNPSCEFRLYDPPRGLNADLKDCDIAFISVPADTKENGEQELCHIHSCLKLLQSAGTYFNTPIVIKSTVLPGTTDSLGEQYLFHRLIHMPEFLTERTAERDIFNQGHICGGRDLLSLDQSCLLRTLFGEVIFMRNTEAELAKYAHNCFGALKVTYFNMVQHISDILGINYQALLSGVLASGYINATHTMVPGPDGKCGFGGKCFPKDLDAFVGFLKDNSHGPGVYRTLLGATQFANKLHRGLA